MSFEILLVSTIIISFEKKKQNKTKQNKKQKKSRVLLLYRHNGYVFELLCFFIVYCWHKQLC